MFDHISWEAIGISCSIIGATYIFIRNLRKDIKEDMDKFEKRWEAMDEKFERRWEAMDNKWVTLLEKFHTLDKDMERSRSFKKAHVN